MSGKAAPQVVRHAPTLKTILMVEHALKRADESVISIADLKRRLPKQVNHNTLKRILEYLEESNKIAVSLQGIIWIENTNKRMLDAIKKSSRYPDDFIKK